MDTDALSHGLLAYLDAIYEAQRRDSIAQVTVLAQVLGRTKASVSCAVKRLEAKGMVRRLPQRKIILTEAGLALAQQRDRGRYQVFLFLTMELALPPEQADLDARALAPCLSPASTAALAGLTQVQ